MKLSWGLIACVWLLNGCAIDNVEGLHTDPIETLRDAVKVKVVLDGKGCVKKVKTEERSCQCTKDGNDEADPDDRTCRAKGSKITWALKGQGASDVKSFKIIGVERFLKKAPNHPGSCKLTSNREVASGKAGKIICRIKDDANNAPYYYAIKLDTCKDGIYDPRIYVDEQASILTNDDACDVE